MFHTETSLMELLRDLVIHTLNFQQILVVSHHTVSQIKNFDRDYLRSKYRFPRMNLMELLIWISIFMFPF